MKKFSLIFGAFILITGIRAQRNPGFLERKNVVEMSTAYAPLSGVFVKDLGKLKFTFERTLTRTFGVELGYRRANYYNTSSNEYMVYYNSITNYIKTSGAYTSRNSEWHGAFNIYFTNYGAIAPRGLYFKIGVKSITSSIKDENSIVDRSTYQSVVSTKFTDKAGSEKKNIVMPFAGFGIRKIVAKRIGINYNFLIMPPLINIESNGMTKADWLNTGHLQKYVDDNFITFNLGLSYIFGIKKAKQM